MKKMWNLLFYVYLPVILVSIIINFLSRILLAISYFFMLEKRKSIDIFKRLFKY